MTRLNEFSMDTQYDGPVILSASITGLFISLSLSKSKIKHVLIGGPAPANQPRLGESINQTASIDFWKFLGPGYAKFWTTKSHISLMISDFLSLIYLGNPRRNMAEISKLVESSVFNLATSSLVHVDRVLFDEQVYQDAISSPFCHFVQSKVAGIDYDDSSDMIRSVMLENGQTFANPTMIFDATGAASIIGTAAKVPKKVLSGEERVIWTHLLVDYDQIEASTWWKYGTNLLRLEQANDGIEGISWLIPLKKRLSVGISVSAENLGLENLSKENAIDLLIQAYDKRGIQLSRYLTKDAEILDTPHQYYVRERAFGPNWMLAGNTYLSIWYPSSSGLATSMYAALFAPSFVLNESGIGKKYEEALLPLVDFHAHLHQMIKGGVMNRPDELYKFWAIWVSFLPGKLSKHLKLYHYQGMPLRVLRSISRLISVHFSLQLLTFGFAITWVKRISTTGQNLVVVPGYFHSKRFLLVNYFRSLVYFFGSKATSVLK